MDRRAFLGTFIAAGCGRKRGSGFDGYAYVANEESQAVAVVDLTAFALVRHIRLQGPPTQVIASPSRPAVYALTPTNGTVHELITERFELARKIRVCTQAVGMRLGHDGALWVLSSSPRRLIRVRTDTFGVEGQIHLPMDPVDFDLSQYHGRAAVSYGKSGSVHILDTAGFRPGPLINFPDDIGIVRMRSDGNAVLAANLSRRALTVIEAPSARLMTHLPLPVQPENFCFNQDQGQLFITGAGMDAVAVVYPHHVPQVAETVLAGHAPAAMAATRDRLFIANPASGDVSIMQIDPNRVIAIAAVGSEPRHIAITPDESYALVLNQKSGDMAVIRIAAIRPTSRNKSAGLFTMIPVGSKPVSAAVRTV